MKVQQLLSLLYSALIQYQQILTQIEQAEIAQCEQTNCSNLSDMRDQLDTLTGEYDQAPP